MSSYVYIENYNKLGTMALSREVFEQIVHEVTDSLTNNSKDNDKTTKKLITLCHQPKVMIRNGQVNVSIDVNIARGQNVASLCKELQEEIASSLTALTEMIPFRIDIKVINIK